MPRDRIGAVIGVAAEKSAVRRNFWKRQAKTVLMARVGFSGKQDGGKDFVVIFSKKIKGLTKEEFKKELLNTLS